MRYRFLTVDLSTSEIATETVDDRILSDFVGGRGFGASYLYAGQPGGVDPLGEQNQLLFLTGPLAGGPVQSASRWMVCTKSPLTNGYARAVGGADFGAWLAFSGYAFIAVTGRAQRPVYLHLDEQGGRILPAGEIWGRDINQTQAWLTRTHGKDTRAACIGIGGENLVRYAGVFSARRSASRCGGGTVMGSKNLKAIAITAAKKTDAHDPRAMRELSRQQLDRYKASPGYAAHRDMGTTDTQSVTNTLGIYPTRNFRLGRLDEWDKITGQDYRRMRSGEFGCYSCPAYCGKAHTVTSGPYKDVHSDGPEYESIWAFTGPIGSTDIAASIAADALCDDLGLDTISTGNCIGFAFELYEKGLLSSRDTDGLELTYGNHGAMIALIHKIATREGIGDILAEGVVRAAARIGGDARRFAIHCKGLEPAAYEPRGAKNMGFNYATANIGASHCYGYSAQDVFNVPFPRKVNRFDEGNADIVAYNQDHTAMNELGICCAFSAGWGWIPDIYGRMLAAATGKQQFADPAYLAKVGERIINVERAFNIREGLDRQSDVLPERMLNEHLIVDGQELEAGRIKDMQGFLDRYYDFRGWSTDGAPTAEKIQELGIGYLLR